MSNQHLLIQLAALLEANRAKIELANTEDVGTSHATNVDNMDRGLSTIKAYAKMDVNSEHASTGVAIYSCYGDPSFGLFGMTLAPAILACGNGKPIIIGFPSILKKYYKVVESIVHESALFPNLSFVLGRRLFCEAIEHQKAIRDVIIFGDSWVSQCMEKSIGHKKRMVFYGPGNNASVILPSANLEKAIEKTLEAAFILNGQAAVCINRCIIDDRIDKFEVREMFERALQKITFGENPMDSGNYVTPIKIKPLVELTDKMVRAQLSEESTLINYKLEDVDGATLVHPSLVWNCSCNSELFKSYKFAPVLPVCFVENNEIAAQVNDTNFGLYVNYWGEPKELDALRNQTKSNHIINLENESILDLIHPDKGYVGPWGGFKYSGFILNEESDWKPLGGAFNLIELLLQK